MDFSLLCSLSLGSREVGHPAAKLMVLAVAIFMDACIKGFKNNAFVGSLMLTIGSELCHEVEGSGFLFGDSGF